MSGIYFHIPFCHRACSYCDFHFSVSVKTLPSVLSAMHREFALRQNEITTPFDTVYFGGGTPSLPGTDKISGFIEKVKTIAGIMPGAEITLECNPEDITIPKLKQWLSAGINRLSIGVQSFDHKTLRFLNRGHTPGQAVAAVSAARSVGFRNISIDLIFAIPGMAGALLHAALNALAGLHPEHISIYQLTIEPRTALGHLAKKGELVLMDEDSTTAQYLLIHDFLSGCGYQHYEISNYALPGYKSKHNASYWSGAHYIGIGPSAHSYNGNRRRWNVSNNVKYVQNMGGTGYYGEEILSAGEKFNELIMTGMRTTAGIDRQAVLALGGKRKYAGVSKKFSDWKKQGWAKVLPGRWILTVKGWLISDMLAADLFSVE